LKVFHRDDWDGLLAAYTSGKPWLSTCGCHGSGDVTEDVICCDEHGCGMPGCTTTRGVRWNGRTTERLGFCLPHHRVAVAA
jgi:hypothetical protein